MPKLVDPVGGLSHLLSKLGLTTVVRRLLTAQATSSDNSGLRKIRTLEE